MPSIYRIVQSLIGTGNVIRGARLLEGVNELGVSFDGLESFIKLSEGISSERGVEAERFVDSADLRGH